MEHGDFKIGLHFWTGTGRWLCTDTGSRVVVAIPAPVGSPVEAGPPYAVDEVVFDEYDFAGCRPTIERT